MPSSSISLPERGHKGTARQFSLIVARAGSEGLGDSGVESRWFWAVRLVHLADDLDQSCDQVWALYVFMGLVENDQLVELSSFVGGVRE